MTEAKDDTTSERDPIAEYWATHGRAAAKAQIPALSVSAEDVLSAGEYPRDQVAAWRLKYDPWSNGRYALAALVWGLLFMLVMSVRVGS